MPLQNSDTPMYDATTRQQGWSPGDMGMAFDVEALVSASYASVAERRRAGPERHPGSKPGAARTSGSLAHASDET
jgi:hypothetical protein